MKTIYKTAKHTLKIIEVDPLAEKKAKERSWRDSELLRTDELVKLPDYPVNLLAYRVLLRDYPEALNYPNGDRPLL